MILTKIFVDKQHTRILIDIILFEYFIIINNFDIKNSNELNLTNIQQITGFNKDYHTQILSSLKLPNCFMICSNKLNC